MRLVNYGAGEITDRLTILALKILHGKAAGKSVEHFEREQETLLSKIRGRTLNGVWFEQVLGLAAVNAALWTAEDEMRHWREHKPMLDGLPGSITSAALRCAFRIQELNDKRAELVSTINANSGEKDGEEKL